MGMMMENTSTTALVILSNLINPLMSSANKTLVSLCHKSKLLHLLRRLAVGLFVVVLHLLRSLPSFLLPFSLSFDQKNKVNAEDYYHHNHTSMIISSSSSRHGGGCGSATARALSQVLSLVNYVPVSSRKYDVVRSLAEKLIHDNLQEKSEALTEVNCVVLSHAFVKTLAQLEAALLDQYDHSSSSTNNDVVGLGLEPGFSENGLVRAARMARGWYRMGWGRGGAAGLSAEKMAAELLWLAQKMVASGGVEVVVGKWAWASNLGWLALSAEPRIQASLVKLTAFMIKQAKDMGKEQDTDQEGETEQQMQTKMKMLTSWLPLLCRASNGTDAPSLSTGERGEIERALEEMIDMLEEEENQEKVLSLWLHHFTHCPSSDWPNLHGSYIRWCTMSRKLLLTR